MKKNDKKEVSKIIVNIENYYGGCVPNYNLKYWGLLKDIEDGLLAEWACPKCNKTSKPQDKKATIKSVTLNSQILYRFPRVCCSCGHHWIHWWSAPILCKIIGGIGGIGVAIILLIGLHYLCEAIGTFLAPLF